jgi:ATP-binding cassette subfamily B (MDR/TAP) protein 1
MAGDEEKTEHRTSSRGDSSDGNDSTRKHPHHDHEKHADTPSPPSEPADLAKLDSSAQVAVKDEDIYSHLPPAEAAILKRQVETPEVASSWKTLYRYSTRNDILIMVVSALCSIVAGAALPLMTVVFGGLAGDFNS